jgi:hypothetical protein
VLRALVRRPELGPLAAVSGRIAAWSGKDAAVLPTAVTDRLLPTESRVQVALPLASSLGRVEAPGETWGRSSSHRFARRLHRRPRRCNELGLRLRRANVCGRREEAPDRPPFSPAYAGMSRRATDGTGSRGSTPALTADRCSCSPTARRRPVPQRSFVSSAIAAIVRPSQAIGQDRQRPLCAWPPPRPVGPLVEQPASGARPPLVAATSFSRASS